MAVSRSDLKAGKRVRVEAFEAAIISDNSVSGTVRLMTSDGRYQYVTADKLTLALPYEDGKAYLSAQAVAYLFKLNADGTGSWLTVNGREPRDYDMPGRPMTEVSIGTDEFTG